MLKNFIYLDNNATSLVHPEVQEFLLKLSNFPINPSAPHQFGTVGFTILEEARSQILNMMNLNPKNFEVIFTSSGTESNNLVMHNFLEGNIIISDIEHPSISAFETKSSRIYRVKTCKSGYIDLEDLESILTKLGKFSKKNLCSFIYAHNETGVIQKYAKEIVKLAHKFDFLVHSDMSQCPGRMELKELEDLDFITLSAHKIGGLIGAGAIIKKKSLSITPLIIGGGQERNLRSGTENILSIACFGQIARIISRDYQKIISDAQFLRNFLEKKLTSELDFIRILHRDSLRLSNTSFFINLKKSSDVQIIEMDLEQIAISTGSACKARKQQTENILHNQGYQEKYLNSTIRISLGIQNNLQDIQMFLSKYLFKNKDL
ncbi:MAG: aminotransferase class V-fold PLP-dependent enzyme [Rickettsia sp.]|nr:aminotransferase class V-fold PLP-dependent enzyme [Rickettsia sp.]